jgi:3',5'-cyclic AMP phosphodiesterase CpdA
MPRRHTPILYTFIILTLLLVTCSSLSPLPTFVPTFTPSLVPTDTLVPTPTNIPTNTPTGTPTNTPTNTPTPTPPPTATPTPSAGNDHFTFAVCGDNRGGDAVYREILRRAVADGSTFLINVGDIVHRGEIGQLEHVRALMADYPIRVFIAPGNHEMLDGTIANYLAIFAPPAPYFSFDYGRVHFVILDSSPGDLSATQLDWLHADLAAVPIGRINMVFLHHPPFDPVGTDHIMGHNREPFMALMQQQGVGYVFAGHIHSYDHELRNGTHYYITGGAGAPLYGHPQREAFYHYLRVRVDGDQVQVELVRLD